MATVYAEHARIYKAFYNEKRLRILKLLRGGEKCAYVLLEQLDMRYLQLELLLGIYFARYKR